MHPTIVLPKFRKLLLVGLIFMLAAATAANEKRVEVYENLHNIDDLSAISTEELKNWSDLDSVVYKFRGGLRRLPPGLIGPADMQEANLNFRLTICRMLLNLPQNASVGDVQSLISARLAKSRRQNTTTGTKEAMIIFDLSQPQDLRKMLYRLNFLDRALEDFGESPQYRQDALEGSSRVLYSRISKFKLLNEQRLSNLRRANFIDKITLDLF